MVCKKAHDMDLVWEFLAPSPDYGLLLPWTILEDQFPVPEKYGCK